MNDEAQFRASRISWMFKESGAEGRHTKIFQNLPEQTKTQLLARAGLGPSEVHALACVASADDWVLATNEQVRWSSAGAVRNLKFSDLADVSVDPSDLRQAGSKALTAVLTLRAISGELYKIELEPGAPFSGFWNALKMMARRGPSA